MNAKARLRWARWRSVGHASGSRTARSAMPFDHSDEMINGIVDVGRKSRFGEEPRQLIVSRRLMASTPRW